MILLELFFTIFVIAIILFGKIEISSTSFKVFIKVGRWNQSLISVSFWNKNSNISI